MLTLIYGLLISYVVSRLQVLDNAAVIKLDQFDTEGKPLATRHMHATWNVVRLIMFAAIAASLVMHDHFTWWVVAIAMVCWNFGYSYVLRAELNKAMEWPKNYLGGTAYYDAFWISIGMNFDVHHAMRVHQKNWNDCQSDMIAGRKCWYSGHVLNRGKWASRFELVATALGLGVLLLDRYV